ncbi:MAG: hypothetical protein ACJ8CB_25355 [Ktedonobacteraceae bacterium]
MSMWSLLGIVIVAGAVGGIINSLINDKGFQLPQVVALNGSSILVPGFIGNIITGAVAAGVSWTLYGPLSQMTLETSTGTVVLATLGGAVLTGAAGSGWLTNAVSKRVLQAAAVNAAQAPSSPESAQRIATASPLKALEVAKEMQSGIEGTRGTGGPAPTSAPNV